MAVLFTDGLQKKRAFVLWHYSNDVGVGKMSIFDIVVHGRIWGLLCWITKGNIGQSHFCILAIYHHFMRWVYLLTCLFSLNFVLCVPLFFLTFFNKLTNWITLSVTIWLIKGTYPYRVLHSQHWLNKVNYLYISRRTNKGTAQYNFCGKMFQNCYFIIQVLPKINMLGQMTHYL